MKGATYIPMDAEEGNKYERRRHLRHLASLKWPLLASIAAVLLLVVWCSHQAAFGPMQLQLAALTKLKTQATPELQATSSNNPKDQGVLSGRRGEDGSKPHQQHPSKMQQYIGSALSSGPGSDAPSPQQKQQQGHEVQQQLHDYEQQQQGQQGHELQQLQQQLRRQERQHLQLQQQLRDQKQLQQQLHEQDRLLKQLREQNHHLQQQRDQKQQLQEEDSSQQEPEALEPPKPPLELTTDAPMPVLPPFEPTCIYTFDSSMENIEATELLCSRDSSCTVWDPKCCAYFNYQMLIFVDEFLKSKCMADQYFALYGTALGAFRNQTILPHTEDIDVGMTVLALQYLQLNGTREELWKHGYASFHFSSTNPRHGFFKMWPHRHHPSPQFQAAIPKKRPTPGPGQQEDPPVKNAVFLDMWPIWPVDDEVRDCNKRNGINIDAVLWTPWDKQFRDGADPRPDYCRHREIVEQSDREVPRAAADRVHSTAAATDSELRHWCVLHGAKPFYTRPGLGSARIGDLWFPSVTDPEEYLSGNFGPGWRSPDPSDHGVMHPTLDGFDIHVALTEKLSVTAWGDMPYTERWERCEALLEQKEEAAA